MNIKETFYQKLQETREQLDEALDSAEKKKEYQEKANKSFSGAFGKKDSKSVKTVAKRIAGLRMSLRKEETEQLDELHAKSKEAIKKVKERLEKDHDDEWQATYDERKREKTAGPGNAKRNKKRNDIAKRWLRADRAEKKLEK